MLMGVGHISVESLLLMAASVFCIVYSVVQKKNNRQQATSRRLAGSQAGPEARYVDHCVPLGVGSSWLLAASC